MPILIASFLFTVVSLVCLYLVMYCTFLPYISETLCLAGHALLVRPVVRLKLLILV